MHRRPRLTALPAALVLALAGCSSAPEVEPTPAAADPACAGVLDRLPDTYLGAARGETDVAGAAVWGEGGDRVVLRCGVTPPRPTTAPCLSVDGVDWVLVEDDDRLRFTTYGRRPAVELSAPASAGRDQAPGALTDLDAAVKPLPATTGCD